MNNNADHSYLPYGKHWIEDDDVEAVVATMRGAALTTGPMSARFETALAARVGAREAVVCNSGTAALHLAMLGLDIGPGDEVIVPAITFLATANAVRLAGGQVSFADVDPASGLMTAPLLKEALGRAKGRRVRAAIPVHMTGQCHDPVALAEVAAQAGISIVEDGAHSLGTEYDSESAHHHVGGCQYSRMTCFSFHPVKTIAMGEGGAVTTSDPELAARLRRLRSHGMNRDWEQHAFASQSLDPRGQPNPWYYEMQEVGLNYRAPDILCALGLSQLGKLDRFLARRRQLAALYDDALASLAPVICPVSREPVCRSSWHIYVVLIDFAKLGIDRAEIMRRLHAEGIGTQVHYIPLYRQPYYRQLCGEQLLPGAEKYYEQALTLPLYPQMSDANIARVAAMLARACGLKSPL